VVSERLRKLSGVYLILSQRNVLLLWYYISTDVKLRAETKVAGERLPMSPKKYGNLSKFSINTVWYVWHNMQCKTKAFIHKKPVLFIMFGENLEDTFSFL